MSRELQALEVVVSGTTHDSPNLDSSSHWALVHTSTDEFLTEAELFIRSGLKEGDTVLVVAEQDRRAELRDVLGQEASIVEFHEPQMWYRVPAWRLGADHRRLQTDHKPGLRLWVLGEIPWTSLLRDDIADWQRYEAVLNASFAEKNAVFLCTYDAQTLPSGVIEAGLATHPMIKQDSQWGPSERYVDPAAYLRSLPVTSSSPPPDAVIEHFDAMTRADLRHAVSSWARERELSTDTVTDLLLALDEVMTNAIEHGGGGGTVRYWTAVDQRGNPGVVCEISSANPLDDPLIGYRPPTTTQERGRGLWLARQVCQRVEVSSGPDGLTVRLWISDEADETGNGSGE